MFRRSIAMRMFVLVMGISLLTYVGFSAIVLTRVSGRLEESSSRMFVNNARLSLAGVQQLFAEQATNVQVWARFNVMNGLATDGVGRRVGRALRQIQRNYEIPGTLYAFDAKGRLVAASARIDDAHEGLPVLWRPDSSGRVRFIDRSADPYTGTQVVAFSVPVFASYPPRREIGTLVLAYRWAAVATLLRSGKVPMVILRRSGVPIFWSVPGLPARLAGQVARNRKITVQGHRWYASRVVAGQTGFPLPWKVAVLSSGAAARAPILQALLQIALLGLALALPLAGLIWLLTRRFIEPIRRLTVTADDISRSSDMSRRVAVDHSDEIGALQEAFNRMTARLQETLQKQERAASSISQLNESLEMLAMTDALTGLPNRRAAEVRLREEFAAARRADNAFSIALFDLDHFKTINDRYGHEAGDSVLQLWAATVRGALRAGDWAARWGGEEFLLVFRDADLGQAHAAAERICQAVRVQTFDAGGVTLAVRASGGISTLCSGTRDLAQMLSEADHCLYGAKRNGRDRVVHAGEMAGELVWRTGALQQALRTNRVVPAYQVIVDLATGLPVADEVLARIVLPDGRIVVAADFIEAAENMHLMHAVDTAIAREALARCAGFIDDLPGRPRRAHFLNLSPQFLAQKEHMSVLLAELKAAFPVCAQTGTGGASPIVLEITECDAFTDIHRLREDLQPLLDFGCRIALDDFGSGQSSFRYLADLPVDFIKIEGWMVRALQVNPKMLRMIQGIVSLAEGLGITTIAESVEDATMAKLLREIGISWAQGYYFGRPKCEHEIDAKTQAWAG